MARLTKAVRQKLLESNEGFSIRTYYEGRNSREERIYTISGGQLHIRAIGKTSSVSGYLQRPRHLAGCLDLHKADPATRQQDHSVRHTIKYGDTLQG